MKNLFKKSDSEAGFTLIELLVVIAIIAILSTVVLASLSQARTRALAAKVNSQLSQIPAAVELAANSGSYSLLGTGTCPTAAGVTSMWDNAASGLFKLISPSSYPAGTADPTINCYSTATSYAVVVSNTVPANAIYCVDSNAQVKTATAAGAAYTTVASAVTASTATCN